MWVAILIEVIMKILVVFGTRPEAIKMAPLITALRSDSSFEVKVCVTGQHRQMLDQVLSVFGIIPDWDLDIMRDGQDLYDVTSKVLLGMKGVLLNYEPDIVLVHGDTTTSMAAALSAFYRHIPVGHVEAGLRTRDIYSPWPEELNRQITARICRWHFAPTENAKKNLLEEAIPQDRIFVTGNTVIDSLLWVNRIIESNSTIRDQQEEYFEQLLGFKLSSKLVILVTGHRRENFGKGFLNICNALKQLAERNTDLQIIYPVHLNPNVRKPVLSILGDISNIHLLDPLDYLSFIFLMKHAKIVLTDSGGIQEEAPSLGKPVLVMRDITERPEGVNARSVRLVGTDIMKIITEVQKLLSDDKFYRSLSEAHNPYGDGKASQRIVNILKKNCL
jgi:UDP-N-acetylglucosamine 2-epimerase (non-hydrolysing)